MADPNPIQAFRSTLKLDSPFDIPEYPASSFSKCFAVSFSATQRHVEVEPQELNTAAGPLCLGTRVPPAGWVARLGVQGGPLA